jgi:hypothetical protein
VFGNLSVPAVRSSPTAHPFLIPWLLPLPFTRLVGSGELAVDDGVVVIVAYAFIAGALK